MTYSKDSELARKIGRLIESLEALQLLCKQIDHHAGEVVETCKKEIEP